jgi:CheY-like chemotaxis protein
MALPLSTAPAAMTAALEGLAVSALESLHAQVDAVEAVAVRSLHAPVPADDAERDDARRCAHKVAGTAGTFAWHDASGLMREAEAVLAADGALDLDAAVRLCELVVAARADLERPPFSADVAGPSQPHVLTAPGAPWPTTTDSRSTVDVVVVEDDLVLASLLCRVVTGLGLTVTHSEDGVGALQLLAGDAPAARPRLILLDIDLPGRSGLSVLRALQRDGVTRDTEVVMLSSRSGAADREQAADLGAASFLSKPFAISDVVACLDRLVEAVPCQAG